MRSGHTTLSGRPAILIPTDTGPCIPEVGWSPRTGTKPALYQSHPRAPLIIAMELREGLAPNRPPIEAEPELVPDTREMYLSLVKGTLKNLQYLENEWNPIQPRG